MSRAEMRLGWAVLVAFVLHGVLLSWPGWQLSVQSPQARPVRHIVVTLAAKSKTVNPVLQPPMPLPQERKIKSPLPMEHKEPPAVALPPVPPEPLPLKVKPLAPLAKEKEIEVEQSLAKSPAPRVIPDIAPIKQIVTRQTPAPAQIVSAPAVSAPPSAAAQVVQQAIPLYQLNPPPRYPRLARRRGLEGLVRIKVLVSSHGRVRDLQLLSSSGHGILDKAALAAVRDWRFTPGTKGGMPAQMWVTVPVRFYLKIATGPDRT